MSANVCENFYEVLGIDQNASILDIRKAYKGLALKFHPDKNNDAGTEEKFKLILEAHNVLIDPVQRAKFDQKLKYYRDLLYYRFKCSMCCATFSLSVDLAEHKRKFHPKKPVKCADCSAIFVTNADLAEHKRKFHTKKLIKCAYCSATFLTNAELAEHQSRKCNQFKTQLNFKCFMCSRSISKPFQCHFCLNKKL